LVPAEIVFELELPLGAPKKEEARSRKADAVAKDQVQAERDFVDEVVHVAVEAAVVIAGEEQPSLIIEENPACEMDGADARQAAARVELPRAEIEQLEDHQQGPKAEAPGLDVTNRAELVAGGTVLNAGQRLDVVERWTRCNDRVGALPAAQYQEEEWRS